MDEVVLDKKRRIAYQFSQSAHRYDDIAQVQLDIGFDATQLVEANPTAKLLDIGCGTGRLTRMLANKCADAYGVDLAIGMIAQAEKFNKKVSADSESSTAIKPNKIDYRVADAEALPFANKRFDTVFSCMALQWCTPIEQSLQEIFRVLTDNGKATIALMTQGSMRELHGSWEKVDSVPRVNQFISHLDVVEAAKHIGFKVNASQKNYTTWHANGISVLNSIRHIGANVVPETGNHPKLSRSTLAKFELVYKQHFAVDDMLPLTYQVSFLSLTKDDAS